MITENQLELIVRINKQSGITDAKEGKCFKKGVTVYVKCKWI